VFGPLEAEKALRRHQETVANSVWMSFRAVFLYTEFDVLCVIFEGFGDLSKSCHDVSKDVPSMETDV